MFEEFLWIHNWVQRIQFQMILFEAQKVYFALSKMGFFDIFTNGRIYNVVTTLSKLMKLVVKNGNVVYDDHKLK